MAQKDTLSRKQERFLQAIVLGESITDAAETAKISRRQAHRWLDDPLVQEELSRLCGAAREAEEREIERIMTTGYAAVHERVKALDGMARLIEKSYRNSETGEMIFQWFLPEKIKEWRGCLDDIARELGHRAKLSKSEITGKDGGPVEFVTEWGGGALEEDDESEG